MAMLLSVGVLALVEVALWGSGVGEDLTLVVPDSRLVGWHRLNPHFDRPFFGRGDLSGPEPRPFQLPKPAKTRRILVVGGSTVIGFPYASEVAFPQHFRAILQAQARDDETIEVLNAGITALNSTTEALVVEEGLFAQPDVIVVYTGHNEFYGPGGVASAASSLSPDVFRLLGRARRWRLPQLLQRWTAASPVWDDLMQSLSSNLHITSDSAAFHAGSQRFADNLTRMAQTARRAGVPIVFVTPVANEHDQPPIENRSHAEISSTQEQWHQEVKRYTDELQWGEPARAVEQMQRALADHAHDALLQYRLGQALEQTGQREEAIACYRAALEDDGARWRATRTLRDVMQDVVAKQADESVHCLDLYPIVCRAEPDGIPGRRHFLEHVHFSWEGQRLVGDAIARLVWQSVWQREWRAELELEAATLDERLAVQPEDHLAALALSMILYSKPPFRDASDSALLTKRLANRSLSIFEGLPPARRKLFEQLTTAEMSADVLTALINAAQQHQRADLAEQWSKARAMRQPWRGDP